MGFNNLNLTNVSTEGSPKLKTGAHNVLVTEATYAPNKNGSGNHVKILMEGIDTAGTQQVSFNIEHQNPEAMKIGQQQLKTFLIAAGHPNPNNPANIHSLRGLRLKLIVEENGTYQGNDGKQYPSYEPAKRGAFQPLNQVVQGDMQSGAQAQNDFVNNAQPQQAPQQNYAQGNVQHTPYQNNGHDGFPV